MNTLNDLNMKYVDVNNWGNEEKIGGAILHCSRAWSVGSLQGWLPLYDSDMLEAVRHWLADESQIAEGQYLEVWVD